MAVTTEKSTQVTNLRAVPPVKNQSSEDSGKLRIKVGNFTQGAAAGDANSTMDLCELPGGARVIPALSAVNFSAFGVGRTLDIGFTAHTKADGTTVVAVVDKFLDGGDVAAAGVLPLGGGTNASKTGYQIEKSVSEGYVTVQGKCLGDTIPAGATVNLFLVYAID